MPEKGVTNNPNGRPKGIANKATQDARAAIATFVEGNVDRLNRLLEAIEKGTPDPKDPDKWLNVPNPQGAFNCLMSVVEYHVPKLARTEHTGDGGGAIQIQNKIDITSKLLASMPTEELKAILDESRSNGATD